jgi:CHASE2 domain-containing sensor protein
LDDLGYGTVNHDRVSGQNLQFMRRSSPPASSSLPKTTPARRSGASTASEEFTLRRLFEVRHLGYTLTGIWAAIAATVTATNLGIGSLMERQAQTLFFEMRGPVTPPRDLVILAIDESSLSQQEFYRADPERYAAFAPIQTWPWQRTAYATAITRLIDAGAQAIALDLIFSTPSIYGPEDDARFREVLVRHADRIALASQYADVETAQGVMTQYVQPLPEFRTAPLATGFINFYLEPNGRIHRQGNQFVTELIQNAPSGQAEAYRLLTEETSSFAEATLTAAQMPRSEPRGNTISFYGPAQTFEQVPFWYVLDDDAWVNALQSGAYFQDKVVIIGSVAAVHQDFHAAPFSKTWLYPQAMAGVEVHANAIATLMQGRSIADALPYAPLRGLMVLLITAGAGWAISRPKQPLIRFMQGLGLMLIWGGVGYVAFIYAHTIVPTAVPVVAIALSSFSQLVTLVAKEQRSKQQLRDAFRRHATSPVIQEILSEQDDFQDLLREREAALAGTILSGRYQITKVLGAGGFSETYIAEDIQRPGKPQCVVKQLRVLSENPRAFKLAHRLFMTEAETLERLGQHDRIPQLLASFEEAQQFYLVQQFVSGHPLSHELLPHRVFSEADVILMIYEVARILEFVHQQGVIHRDLKPANIIRRDRDARLVLIDFGVAKRISTQVVALDQNVKFTIAVGTPGYMPPEQLAGKPRYNSDLYALGMIAIEAVTGQPATAFPPDPETGLVNWAAEAPELTAEFVAVLSRMVDADPHQRFGTAQAVVEALQALTTYSEEAAQQVVASVAVPTTHAQEETQFGEGDDADAENTAALPSGWRDTTVHPETGFLQHSQPGDPPADHTA